MAKIQITDEEVQAECERLRALTRVTPEAFKRPVTDLMLTQLIRSKMAPLFFDRWARGLMPLGEFKKRLVAGEYPNLVAAFTEHDEFPIFVRRKLKATKEKKNYKLKGPGLVILGVGYGVQS